MNSLKNDNFFANVPRNNVRMTYNQELVQQAVNRISEWIRGPGDKLLQSQNSLPRNFEEAETLRKAHEQFEFKCTESIGFYAELAEFPRKENANDPLYHLDIEVQEFLQKLHTRRAIVVSCYTFFRLLKELREKIQVLIKVCNENVTGNVLDNDIVKKRLDRLENLLKSVGTKKDSLRHERQRLRLLLGDQLPSHLENAIREVWKELTQVEQMTSLKQLEWRKDAQMIQCRVEAERSIAWLATLCNVLQNSYRDSVIGKTPIENAELIRDQDQLMRKAEEAYQFTERVIQALMLMCQSQQQPTRIADQLTQQLQTVWRPYQNQHAELRGRRDVASIVYEHVDSILTRVESLLVTLAKGMEVTRNNASSSESIPRNTTSKNGKEAWRDLLIKHSDEREEIIDDYEETAKIAAALSQRLGLNLIEKPDKSLEENQEVESTRAIIRMKLYTLWIKIIELDDYLGKREKKKDQTDMVVTTRTTEIEEIDITIRMHVNKFLEAMAEYEKQWRFVKLPRSLTESSTAMQRHADCSRDIKQQWIQIQQQLGPLARSLSQARDLMEHAGKRRDEWENAWKIHQERLDIRHEILVRLDQWTREVYKPRETGLGQLKQLIVWENVESFEKWNERIQQWRQDIPSLDQRLESIMIDIRESGKRQNYDMSYSDDFINDSSVKSIQDSWTEYKKRLILVGRLVDLVKPIHVEVLPFVDQFVADWPSRINECQRTNDNDKWKSLSDDAKNVKERLSRVNEIVLRQTTRDIYNDEKPIEPLLRRLHAPPLNGSNIEFQEIIDRVFIIRTLQTNSALSTTTTTTTTNNNWQYTDPTFKKTLEDQRCRPGQSIDLHCRISLLPDIRPIVKWFKGDLELTPNRCAKLGYETDFNDRTGDCYLSVLSAEVNHATLYTCVVKNIDNGRENRTSARIILDDTVKARLKGPLDAPRHLESGQDIHLSIQYEGIPAPAVTWYKDSKVINGDGRRIFVTTTNTESHLKIKPGRSSDSGSYAVEVRNDAGCDSSVVTIHVLEKESPPKFLRGKDLLDQHVTEGDRIFLRAELESSIGTLNSDHVRIVWSKDGRIISPTSYPRYQTSTLGSECRLVIPEVTEGDSGRFRLTVENDAGKIESHCDILVQPLTPVKDIIITKRIIQSTPTPTKTTTILMEDDNLQNSQRTTMVLTNTVVRSPPEFLQLFADEICSPGDAVIFTAQIVGLPKPAVWWSYNGQFLQANTDRGARCEFVEEAMEEQGAIRYSLVLERVTSADAGRYSLTAENSTGLATCSALLLVSDTRGGGGGGGDTLTPDMSRYNSLGSRSILGGRNSGGFQKGASLSSSRPMTPNNHDLMSPLTPHTHLSYVSPATANQPGAHFVEITPRSNSAYAFSSNQYTSTGDGVDFATTTRRTESSYRRVEVLNEAPLPRTPRTQIIFAQTDGNYDAQLYSTASVVESSDFEEP